LSSRIDASVTELATTVVILSFLAIFLVVLLFLETIMMTFVGRRRPRATGRHITRNAFTNRLGLAAMSLFMFGLLPVLYSLYSGHDLDARTMGLLWLLVFLSTILLKVFGSSRKARTPTPEGLRNLAEPGGSGPPNP
jgi:hypothetical protein